MNTKPTEPKEGKTRKSRRKNPYMFVVKTLQDGWIRLNILADFDIYREETLDYIRIINEFPTLADAIKAAKYFSVLCRENHVHIIQMSPRLMVTINKTRKIVKLGE